MIGKREMQKITMTEKEAIKLLNESYIVDYEGDTDRHRINLEKFLISTLEEIQQYREIGTVEEVEQNARDLKRQIEHSEHLAEVLKSTKSLLKKREQLLADYCKIGTVKECRKAREKQKAISAIRLVGNKYPYKCPTCGNELELGYKHCIYCGQPLKY